MKKILYIAVSSSTGGVPKHILNALKANKDYKIIVAVPNDGDYYHWFKELAADMVEVSLKPFSLHSLFELKKYITRNKVDLVHAHGKGAGMYARALKFLCPEIKAVYTFHGIYLEQYGTVMRNFYIMIERVLKNLTDAFICVSESEREEAARLKFSYPQKTFVIPNGVAPDVFDNIEVDRLSYLKQFEWSENNFIIGCVARLEAMKGHKFLIEAFEEVLKLHPECRLLLVGDGPYRLDMEQLVMNKKLENKVYFTGFRHDIPQLLKIFDIFVSCSLKEGMPYTLLEAQAAGIPVVATNVIGNRDIIKDGYSGTLAESQNSENIKAVLLKMIENGELREKCSENGLKNIEKNFTVQKSTERLFAIYKRLLEVAYER